jgi:hypothetical protein
MRYQYRLWHLLAGTAIVCIILAAIVSLTRSELQLSPIAQIDIPDLISQVWPDDVQAFKSGKDSHQCGRLNVTKEGAYVLRSSGSAFDGEVLLEAARLAIIARAHSGSVEIVKESLGRFDVSFTYTWNGVIGQSHLALLITPDSPSFELVYISAEFSSRQ